MTEGFKSKRIKSKSQNQNIFEEDDQKTEYQIISKTDKKNERKPKK